MTKLNIKISSDKKRIISIVLGTVLSCVILVLVASALTEMRKSNLLQASIYLLFVFIVQGLSKFFSFLKERTRANLLRFILLLVYDIGLGVTIFFGKDNPYLYQMSGALFCISFIFDRLYSIYLRPKIRSIIFHGSLALFGLSLAIALFIPNFGNTETIVSIICIFIAVTTFVEVIVGSTKRLNPSILSKIISKTYALEIIMGLLTTIVAFSLVLMLYEEKIQTFEDGLWYSFSVVTTIGFGDIIAKTLVGRIVTVILGVYGIVVVAVITSIIVNFYNEMTKKEREKEKIDSDNNKDKKSK